MKSMGGTEGTGEGDVAARNRKASLAASRTSRRMTKVASTTATRANATSSIITFVVKHVLMLIQVSRCPTLGDSRTCPTATLRHLFAPSVGLILDLETTSTCGIPRRIIV